METLGLFLVVAVLAVGLGLRGRVRGGAVWKAFQNRTKPRAALAEYSVLAAAGSPSSAAGDGDVLVPVEATTPATVSLLTAVSPPAPAAPILVPVAPAAPSVTPVVAPVAPAAPLFAPVVAPVGPSTPSTPATAVKAVAPATKPKTVAAKATAPKAVAATTAAPAGKTATKAAPATKTTARQAAATTTRPAAKTTTARQTAATTTRPATKTATARPKTITAPPKAAAARPRKTATKSAPVPSCTALVDNPAPVSGDTVVVTVASNVPTTPFTVTAHYRSKKTVLSGVTDGAGTGSVTFDIGAATKGYKVKVDVNVSGKATCGTEFTPR